MTEIRRVCLRLPSLRTILSQLRSHSQGKTDAAEHVLETRV
jgi:hypothetical protein